MTRSPSRAPSPRPSTPPAEGGAEVGAPFPLEPDAAAMRAMVDAAMERVVAFVESLPGQPAADLEGAADVARALRESLPESGTPFGEILDLVFERAVPTSYNTAGPGYLAYIPGGGLFHSAVADLIGDVVNRYVGVWIAAPGAVQIEANAVRWLCEIVGYPAGALGFLTSGGSLANFSAIVVARRELLPEDFLAGTLYASDQVHHSVQKAAMLAGFPEGSVRVIPSDGRFRIRPDLLEEAVARDRRAGRRPFFVVGSAGTTNTGAVDDLDALADVAARHGLWFHADAAYGGFFMLTERGRRAMAGLGRAHSVTLDPHKGLFLPYGVGSLLVRDGEALTRAHALWADYLPAMQEDPDFVDFCQISPELSRPFRGIRVWLPLKLLGAGAFRRALDEKLDLAEWAAEELRAIPELEIVAEPQLSLVAFRLRPPGMEGDALDRLNREFLARVNRRGRVYLTGTTVGLGLILRICVLSFRTHRDRMEMALEDIREAVGSLRYP